MFEKEETSSIMKKFDKPLDDQFVCPETKEHTSCEACESTCEPLGCLFIKTCKAYKEWKNQTERK